MGDAGPKGLVPGMLGPRRLHGGSRCMEVEENGGVAWKPRSWVRVLVVEVVAPGALRDDDMIDGRRVQRKKRVCGCV